MGREGEKRRGDEKEKEEQEHKTARSLVRLNQKLLQSVI